MKAFLRPLIATAVFLGLFACGGVGVVGGGGGGGSTPPPVQNASAGGIWKGTDPISGLPVTGIITESGQLQFLRSDGAQYYGTVSTSGINLSGTYSGIAAIGNTFSDGSTYGSGTISGTVQERQTLSGTLTFTTSLGTKSSGSGSFTFDSLYDSGSSLSTIAGNYADNANNAIVNVTSNGTIFSQSATTGCVINGQISIINASYDAYGISYSYSNCLGSAAYLNGTTVTGLGVLYTTASPVVAYIGVFNAAAHYGLTMELPKQ